MSFTQSRTTILTGWMAAVAAAFAVRVLVGADAPSMTETVAWLLACAGPAAVLAAVFRGPPPPTVAELLSTTESTEPTRPEARAGRP